MHASASTRSFRTLALIASALLLAACGQGDGPDSISNEPVTPLPPSSGDPFDSGLLTNGDFEAGVDPWIGNAANVVDDGGNLVNFADITAAGQPFDVNLSQVVAITEGETYTLTFKARSDRARTMLAGIGLNVEPFTNITQTVNLTTDWQTFQFDITATGFGGADSRVLFDMGADIGQVLIDDVSLTVAGPGGSDPSITPDAALFTSAGDPDLVIPDDYLERTAFGSGSIIDPAYADDETYSPVLSVFSGTGYGANVAQVGFIGFPEGFLTQYETVDFKVKGMPGFVIFVKLFDGVDALRLNLTSSDYSAELENGWFQVSIPVADFSGAAEATGIVFESDDTSATEFRMLLNDVGFSGTGSYVPADPGVIPEVTLYDRDGTPDLVIPDDYAEISVFGSDAVIDDNFRDDLDFSPALAITTGFGYDVWNAQLAYLGFDPGFAAGYETLDFKVKGLSGDVIRVKFLNDPDPPYLDIDVTTSAFATDLGNGWYQVSVPVTEFEAVATATDLLFETIAPAPDESFTYLLTDVGFSGDVPVDTTTSVDFEGDTASLSFDNFGGGESTVIANPDQSGINTSAQVVQMTRTSESDFGGSTLALPEGVDWSQGEVFRMKVWSQREVPVLFKVEGTPPAEQSDTHDGGSLWQELCFDFTDNNAGPPVTGISIFFDLGAVGDVANDPDNWTFYYDDIRQTTEPCPVPPPEPGDHGPGTAGVFTETTTESTITVTSITNSIDFGGNNTVADPASTAIPAFEGDVVLSIDYQDSGSTFGGAVLNFGGVDLTAYDTLNFTVDTSGIAGFADLTIQIEPPGAGAAGTNVLLSSYTPVATSGNWATYAIPLADFTATDFSAAANLGFWNPIDGTSGLAFGTLYVDDVYFSTEGGGGGGGGGATGELVINGGFETGDLTGWEPSPNGGTITTTSDSSAGSFAANLNITAAGNPTLKAANLAAGALTPGQEVTVSFDWKGSDANGGVVDVRLFSELSGGGVSATEIILEGAGFPADWTTVGPLTITTGPDVSGGITLQFTAICGAVAGCVSDIYIDNVSIISGDAPVDTTTSVDFEGDTASLSFDNFGGGESTVIANPDPSGINTSGQVVQMTKTSASDFGGSTLALPEGVDWSQGEIFRMKVWSQREVPVLFKVEGTPAVERDDTHDGGSVWQELCFDFTGDNAGPPVTGISIFFDLGAVGDLANNPDDWTFYYDDIEQTSEPCPVPPPPAPEFTTITFDDPATTYTLTDFGGTASTVTNDPAGGANQVVLTVKSDTAQVWAGTTVSTLPGEAVPVIPLDADNTQMSVRVYSPDAGIPVRLKIEDASDPAIAVETEAVTTTVNAWETLTFDFANEAAGPPFNPAATYSKVSIFFNFGTDGATAGEKTYYFDDIDVGPGDGAPGGGELLTNGDFEASAADKAPWVNAGSVATNNFYTADALDGQQVFDTNLSQVAAIAQGTEYVLSFRARASVARDMIAGIGLSGAPFTAETETAALTTEWQSYSYNLTAVADIGTAESRVLFDMGGVTSTVNIDDVSLTPAGGGGELLTNGDFEASAADKAPWVNAGSVATNNFYTADALNGQQVFDTNLSQVAAIAQGTEYVLGFRARASVARDMIAGIGLNGAPFTAETETVPLTTEWQSYSYNLTAVADIGTAESRVLFDMGGVTSTVNIDDVSLTEATGGGGGGGGGAIGELAINGGFETGDFTGWETSVNGGTITTTSDSSAGSFAANLNITAAGNPTLKAANLAAGALTPGQQVTVSFDWKGSDANGGVVDVRLFSELSGGGVSATEIILEGAGFPADWTTVGPLTITTGPDVSGGVTLQFTAICGAVAGCVSDIYIDNVSIVAN